MRHPFAAICLALAVLLVVPPISRAENGKEMLIGLIPEENIFKQMDRYRPLAKYLSDKLGITVKLTILSRYGDIIDGFTSRKMDGAFFGVFTGALAREKLGVEPLVRPVNLDGTSFVQSYVFVRKDSGIKGARDMKGKRMVFVDRATVTGYLYGLSFLKEAGVVDIERYFKEHYFTGSHDSTVYSVLDNRADVGVAKSSIFNTIVQKDPVIKEELVVIAKSRDFPTMILSVRKDLQEDLKSRLKSLLLGMDRIQDGKAVLAQLGALKFISTETSDFEPFHEIVRKTGIDLKTYRYR